MSAERMAAPGSMSVGAETFDALETLCRDGRLRRPSPFVLPGWARAWYETFGRSELQLTSIRCGGEPIGVAPLQTSNRTAAFVGSPDVCDHLDLALAPGSETAACDALVRHLLAGGTVDRLDLGPCRPDSAVMRFLLPVARGLNLPVEVAADEAVYELPLASSWDAYLESLPGKERHEIRRKLRRGGDSFRFQWTAGGADAVDHFLSLFRRNRADKAAFMDPRMEGYFRRLATRVPETRIGLLHVDGAVAAAVWCMDLDGTRYLYNSAYDAEYSGLSVGIACKLLSIRDAVERGLARYDFLKGEEAYKRRLGGVAVPLARCRVDLRP